MSTRTTLGRVLSIGGVIGLCYGLWGLIDIGSCGGDGAPPCPPEATKYFIAMFIGVPGMVIGSIIGKSGGFLIGIPAVAGMLAVKAFTDREPGERLGLLIPAIVLGIVALGGVFAAFRFGAKQARIRDLVTTGSKARGVVTGMRDTGVRINDQPRIELDVRLEPLDGTAPWEDVKKMTVSELRLPRVGEVYPVWYDPSDKATWAIGVPTGTDAPDPELLEQFGITPTWSEPGDGADIDDRVESLALLADLRDRGALSAEEFEREKARLLDGEGD